MRLLPMVSQLLWVIFPYLCIFSFITGHIFRFRYDQFNWTAKSSEFIEKKTLKYGSLMFHIGIVPVFLGHVVGLGVPKEWTRALGISDHLYHLGAAFGGGFFGIITLIGMILLTYRRLSVKAVRKLSSVSDIIVNLLLLFIVFIGVYATFFTTIAVPDFDYRETISVWFRGLLVFSPDAVFMNTVPLSFQLHVLTGFLIIGLWPYTRLVHVWSVPVNYVGRSYIIYRKHR